jgi:hypothetical protein
MSDETNGALRVARDEARATLDAQLSTLDDIDSKALSVFRLNVAVASLLVSVLSLAVGIEMVAVGSLLGPSVGVALALFVLSAAGAGLTYAVGGEQVGVGPASLRGAEERSESAYLAWLVDGYADWIAYNERTNARKALLVTLSALGTVAGTLALGVGAVGAATGQRLLPAAAAGFVLLVNAGLAGLPSQIRRLLTNRTGTGSVTAQQSGDAAMVGQHTFTGRDRED